MHSPAAGPSLAASASPSRHAQTLATDTSLRSKRKSLTADTGLRGKHKPPQQTQAFAADACRLQPHRPISRLPFPPPIGRLVAAVLAKRTTMYRSITAIAILTAVVTIAAVCAQPPGATHELPHRDSDLTDRARFDKHDSLIIIEWRPPYIDWERIEYALPASRSDSSSVLIRVETPRHMLDRETFTIWRTIINNGSMGNWHMLWPAGYLDARTLSFPLP